ncbi:MAG: helix-turn-helix transcriptional regulator [Anaerolineales bacterium]|nr:helix-turn-helix transcriptional regulator [Anaerolineales bacterium]
MPDGFELMAELCKMLSHPVRLQILTVLSQEEEACVCHLEHRLQQRQAYISQQLARLREMGLVADRRDGMNVFYMLADRRLTDLIETIRRFSQGHAARQNQHVIINELQPRSGQQCSCPKCNQTCRGTEA